MCSQRMVTKWKHLAPLALCVVASTSLPLECTGTARGNHGAVGVPKRATNEKAARPTASKLTLDLRPAGSTCDVVLRSAEGDPLVLCVHRVFWALELHDGLGKEVPLSPSFEMTNPGRLDWIPLKGRRELRLPLDLSTEYTRIVDGNYFLRLKLIPAEGDSWREIRRWFGPSSLWRGGPARSNRIRVLHRASSFRYETVTDQESSL